MMAAEGLVPIIGVVLACAALAVSRASLHRRLWPKLGCARPRPKPSRALSDAERTRVLDVLRSPRFVDQSPAEVVYTLLDEGEYLCPSSTVPDKKLPGFEWLTGGKGTLAQRACQLWVSDAPRGGAQLVALGLSSVTAA